MRWATVIGDNLTLASRLEAGKPPKIMSNERLTFPDERSRKAIEARPVPRGIRKPGVAPPLLAIPLSQLEGVHLVPDVGDHDAILVAYDPLPEWAAVNVGVGWVGGGLAGSQRKVRS